MESGISGFKVSGSWEEIVEHGEKMESILETIDEKEAYELDSEMITEFNEWRPKVRDLGDESEISDKTAEKASIAEGESEKKEKPMSEDIEDAASEVSKSVSSLKETEIKDSWEYWKSTTSYMTKASDTFWRRNLRRVEKFVYKHLMTVLSPYYFDNTLISANLQRKSEETYVFEININDDELKQRVEHIMHNLSDRDRWHLSHDHAEDVSEEMESVEGVDPVSDTASMDSQQVREDIQDQFKDNE